MRGVGDLEHAATLLDTALGVTEVHVGGREPTERAVVMLEVVPVEEIAAQRSRGKPPAAYLIVPPARSS
ncbi:hypothetical protein D3C83_231770 [compost metagenome]